MEFRRKVGSDERCLVRCEFLRFEDRIENDQKQQKKTRVRVKNVFEPVCQKLNHFSETVYEILKISLVAVSFLILGPSSYCLFQYQSKSIFSLANCWLNPFSLDVEVDAS